MTDNQAAGSRFELPIRVYIEDTDAGGIVFHAKYLHYMERARTEYVRHHGIALRAGLADNISYVVQRLSIHYAAAARLDDRLSVSAELVACGRVWMEFDQKVTRAEDGVMLAEARVKVACVALDSGRPRRIPDSIRSLVDQDQ
ncbi:MAG: tol-pal system-associated acyl-CoA thioesterase [Marinobacter sp.]|uniref:tol-pal system-associated acyl-CoA thioesterase n=1 Tax=Marinobacter sp. TaxID=50741 RepID=UPI00299D2B95|nr:tol-pal system-associated acyl-CoA thioesterase [Marinobacter sp.]MDX1633065.1 tol-pal system-associated acyl-CoA thioesterase [Marinobacter sp.]